MKTPPHFDGHFCAFCGHVFEPSEPWPRSCPVCQGTTEPKHIPLISVIAPCDSKIRCSNKMPRQTTEGVFLPSTFLDFGETWRQAAARCIGADPAKVRFRSFDVLTLEDEVTNIFALLEGGAEEVPEGAHVDSPVGLTDDKQRHVVEEWLSEAP